MVTFILKLFIFGGILLIAGAPVVMLAHRRGLPDTVRRFRIAGIGIAVFIAAVSANSERLVGQCRAAGNLSCLDFGASGVIFVLVIGYCLTAAVRTFNIYRDR